MSKPLLFILAIEGSLQEIERRLLEKPARGDVDDALRSAALHGRSQACALLAPHASTMGVSNALIQAAQAPSLECAQVLAPLAQPRHCAQALSFAASKAPMPMIELLLNASADAPVGDAFRVAARENRVDILDLLMRERGCEDFFGLALELTGSGAFEAATMLAPLCRDASFHQRALSGACCEGRLDIALVILEQGLVDQDFAADCAALARRQGYDDAAGAVEAFFLARELSEDAALAPTARPPRL